MALPRSNTASALLLLLSFVATAAAHADPYNPIPGMIPRAPGNRAAGDLVYQGRVLDPVEAEKLATDSGVDLSRLDPDSTSDLWKPRAPLATADSPDRTQPPASNDDDFLPLRLDRPFTYLGAASSQPGNFRFLVQQSDASGVPRSYAIFASKTLHSMLLRKALLRKLGYVIPRTGWIPKMRVEFRNSLEREAFTLDLKQRTYGEKGRWVVGGDEEGSSALDLQDLVAVEDQDQTYNLSNGFLDAPRIRGRRLMNALLVPYALVTSKDQSVNLLPWNAGHVVSGNVELPYDYADQFSTSYEDARWIARRILALSRADWADVVSEAKLPAPVAALMVEKLISRRNTLGPLFHLEKEPEWIELPIHPKISYAQSLENGKLLQKDWAGYATRFAAGDPENPIDGRQIRALVKSNLVTSGIETALSLINQIPVFSTDINQKLESRAKSLMTKQIENALSTGEPARIPVGAYVFPTWNANLTVSRELAVGSYMGADNLLQLADSFGYSVALGGYLSIDGLPSPIRAHAAAGIQASRTFTHLRPVKTVQAALKYPFENVVVSRLLRKEGRTLLDKVDENFSKLPPDEQRKILEDDLAELKDSIEVGSSLMITDSLNVGGDVGADWRPYKLVSIGGDLGLHDVVLRRVHILRKSSDEFQVYLSKGSFTDRSATITLDARIPLPAKDGADGAYYEALDKLGMKPLKEVSFPILTFAFDRQAGKAATDFFDIGLDPDQLTTNELRDRLGALDGLLANRSSELLRALEKPYRAEYDFDQKLADKSFLFLTWKRIRNSTHLSVESPTGAKIALFRDYLSKTFGLEAEKIAGDTLSDVLQALSRVPVSIATSEASNPGYSILGKARNRVWTFEAEETSGALARKFVKLSEVWNGWSIQKDKAQKILDQISEKYGTPVFPANALTQTRKILLYSIEVDTYVYEPGLDSLLQMPEERVRALFAAKMRPIPGEAEADVDEVSGIGDDELEDRARTADGFLSLRRKAIRDLTAAGPRRSAKKLLKALAMAESELTLAGFTELVGGEGNFLVAPRVDGFRLGDEAGDASIEGNTIGSLGSVDSSGPMNATRLKSGMTEGEFLLGWILRRAL